MGHGVPDYGAGADEHDPSHAEQFPRAETAQLVADSIQHEASAELLRSRAQTVLLGLAATCVALAFPSGIIVGRTLSVVPMDEYWNYGVLPDSTTDYLPHLAARWMSRALGWSYERSWFTVAALALGGTVMLLHAWARRRAWPPILVWPALIAVIVAPVSWLAGATPGTASCSMLGAALVFVVLDARAKQPWSFAVVAGSAWIVASFLSVSNLLLLPAVIWCVALETRRRSPLAVGLVLLSAVIWFFAWKWTQGSALSVDVVHDFQWLGHKVLPRWCEVEDVPESLNYPPFLSDSLARALPYLVLLGGAWLGIAWATREAARSGWQGVRTKWWLAFAFVPPLAMVLSSGLERDLPFVGLAPVAFAGLLEMGARWKFAPWAAIGVSLLAFACVRHFDHDEHWRAVVERDLERGDVVFTTDDRHAYLMRERYGIEVVKQTDGLCLCVTDSRFEETTRAMSKDIYQGRRIVLDGDFGSEWLFPGQHEELLRRSALELPGRDR